MARADDAVPPFIDIADGAAAHQPGQDAGADQRGLADAAHPESGDEGAAADRAGLQPCRDLANRAEPAEEDFRVLGLERLEAAGRRAFDRDRPGYLLAAPLQPQPEMAVELFRELVARIETVETGGEMAFLVAKPFHPEGIERAEIGLLLLDALGIEKDSRAFLVDEDVGHLALERGVERFFGIRIRCRSAMCRRGGCIVAATRCSSRFHRMQTTMSQLDGAGIAA